MKTIYAVNRFASEDGSYIGRAGLFEYKDLADKIAGMLGNDMGMNPCGTVSPLDIFETVEEAEKVLSKNMRLYK